MTATPPAEVQAMPLILSFSLQACCVRHRDLLPSLSSKLSPGCCAYFPPARFSHGRGERHNDHLVRANGSNSIRRTYPYSRSMSSGSLRQPSACLPTSQPAVNQANSTQLDSTRLDSTQRRRPYDSEVADMRLDRSRTQADVVRCKLQVSSQTPRSTPARGGGFDILHGNAGCQCQHRRLSPVGVGHRRQRRTLACVSVVQLADGRIRLFCEHSSATLGSCGWLGTIVGGCSPVTCQFSFAGLESWVPGSSEADGELVYCSS